MRETDDAPPVDCPACGTPTDLAFAADAACPVCAAPLVARAQAAQVAIASVTAAVDAASALPTRLRAGLKARLFEADRLLAAALVAGERVGAASVAQADGLVEAEVAPAVVEEGGTASPVVIEEGGTASPAVIEEGGTASPAVVEEGGTADGDAAAVSPVVIKEGGTASPVVIEEGGTEASDAAAPVVVEEGGTPAAAPVVVEEGGTAKGGTADGDAAADAPVDTDDFGTATPDPDPIRLEPPVEPAEPRRPSLWQRLGPAFAEHLLFFLGGFLLLAGAVYFVSTAWTTMTGTSQLLVIEGGILLFGAGLVGAGRLLNRDRTLDDLDAVLATAGAACVPLAALAVGRQCLGGLLPGLGGLALWAPLGFAIMRWGLTRVDVVDRRVAGGLQLAGLGAIVGPLLPGWPVAVAVLPIAIGAWAALRSNRWPVHAVAFIAASATAGQIAIHTGAWGVLALPLIASGVVFSRHRALSHSDDLVAVGLAVGAFALGLLTPNAALVCGAAGCFIAARAAVHRERSGLLIAAFVLGLAAYVLLPAPIKGIVLALKAKAAAGLGYAGGRLPLAWYGVTCLPYVALCGWAARRLGDTALARTARLWTLGIAAALCLLAFTTSDLRAPLLVLPLEGLLLLGLAFWIPSMRMAQAAPVLLAALPVLATLHFDLPVSTIPLGIALVALALRAVLPRRGAMVHGVYQSCACLLAGAAGLAVVPAVWAGAAVHWLDLIAAPLLVLAVWPIRQLRPLALLALHRMVPALVALTGLWTWPAAALVAIGATLAIGAWRTDRHPALVGWALLAVAVLGGGYAIPFGVDATIGLFGAAVVGVALAWGTRYSPLAAVALLCFAGAAASVAWIFDLRPSRIGMTAALALSLGIITLGWLHRRHPAVYARIGRAPSLMGLLAALFAVLIYLGGDAAGLIKKRSLITLGVGLLAAMAAAPRIKRLADAWTVVGIAAIWLIARGVFGVLPGTMPVAGAAVLAAVGVRIMLRFAPRALPAGPALFDRAWPGFLFLALLQTAAGPAVGLWDAAPLIGLIALTHTRRGWLTDGLAVAALALLLVGPILAPLVSLEWAPLAIFLLGAVGYQARRFAWAPRGFEALLAVAAALWVIFFGPALVGAVAEARVQSGPAAIGIGWIGLGVAALAVFQRKTPLRVVIAAPLLWWAPIATLVATGPARATPSLAALALITCVIARRRPPFLWAHLGIVALLTLGLWAHPLTPITAALITATIGLAAWRWGRPTETEATPWLVAGAGTVAALWFGIGGPIAWGQIGVSCAVGALLAAATGRHALTVWALALAGIVSGVTVTDWGVSAAVLATAALVVRAWRAQDVAAREGAAAFGAVTAALVAWWMAPALGTVPLAGLAAFGAIAVAAWWRCTGVTLGVLMGFATCLTLVGPIVSWPAGVAGVALVAIPLLIWRRRGHPFALEGAIYGLAVASVLWIAWAHAAPFPKAIGRDAIWSIAAVALLAAVLNRKAVTVCVLAGVWLTLQAIDPYSLHHLIGAGLVAAAFGALGRRVRLAWDIAFAPLAWAAVLAVHLGFEGASRAVFEPWAAAAIGAVAIAAALTRRHGATLLALALAAGMYAGLRTLHLGNAVAAVACAAAFVIKARRSGAPLERLVAWCMAPLALTAVIGWALQLSPGMPLLAWGAAASAVVSACAARIDGWPDRVAAILLASTTCVTLLFAAVIGDPIGVAGAGLIGAVVALIVGWFPRLGRHPQAAHGLLALLAALHFALLRTTPWLDALAGHHFEAWGVLAVLLAVCRSLLPRGVATELTPWFVGLPILALVTATDAATVARAAFVGALTWGMASRGGARWLRYAAFGLANVGAWAFWLNLDLVDPTLYGLPPGLTLLALAEVERGRLSARAHTGLLALGFALAYGGMAVQIVTVGGALHAALLLVGGLASVGVGWRTRRVDLLVGGTAAVILDVACYLLRHGFQQNFVSAGLLLFAGATVLLAATVAARMRRTA